MDEKQRPPTSGRTFRVEDDLWHRAMRRASERDETLSEAIRKFLERYAK